jgi:hypothetical protein
MPGANAVMLRPLVCRSNADRRLRTSVYQTDSFRQRVRQRQRSFIDRRIVVQLNTPVIQNQALSRAHRTLATKEIFVRTLATRAAYECP